jgi:lipopolysaccharide transport system ATP-binding protein
MDNCNEILVEVKGVSKKFSRNLKRSLVYGLKDVFMQVTGLSKNGSRLRETEFWAVKDISFQLKRGECLGLIGHNGAGKSTLLKMLNGLIKPDEGEILMRGRIGALIELGAGFNPVLTGRENIYVNGQILGLSKKEIDEKLKTIIEFSELGEFIDAPVQNYSSGMKVRLGFAVAAQMEPDVLIIDEVLAVGDLGFILKCFNTIDKIMARTAVIFVSHKMPMVSRICDKVILMDNGKTAYSSNNVAHGIDLYYKKFSSKQDANIVFSNNNVELISASIKGHDKVDNIYNISWNQDVFLCYTIRALKDMATPRISLAFYDKEERGIAEAAPKKQDTVKYIKAGEEMNFTLKLSKLCFSKGVYYITITVSDEEKGVYLKTHKTITLQVVDERQVWTSYLVDTEIV